MSTIYKKQYTINDFVNIGLCNTWAREKIEKFLDKNWSGTVIDVLNHEMIPTQAKLWLFIMSHETEDWALNLFSERCWNNRLKEYPNVSNKMPQKWKQSINIQLRSSQEQAMAYSVKAMLRARGNNLDFNIQLDNSNKEAEWQLETIIEIIS